MLDPWIMLAVILFVFDVSFAYTVWWACHSKTSTNQFYTWSGKSSSADFCNNVVVAVMTCRRFDRVTMPITV